MNISSTFKIFSVAAVAAVFLSGCAQKLWFGQNPQRDLYECQAEAARTYSPAMYNTTFGTGYRTPSYTSCNAYGYSATCTTTGGNYVPPAQITLDANEGNRKSHIAYCMTSRGNQLMTQAEYDAQRIARRSYESPTQQQPRNQSMCQDKYSISYIPEKCEQ